MTLYQKFKKLDIDFSQLSLEPGDTHGGYYCTPKGANVIGWAGIDGIHCCFVDGFGETVFAVNPANLPGENVHPLASSFEDFLRLILACGLDAAEQAWMWNRGEFDAFLETVPPDDERQAVLSVLRDKLSLTPMDDPYGYIRALQASFDYSKIPYQADYYDCLPEKPKTPERPEWKVYFAHDFGSRHVGHDRPGTEIPINQTFHWNGKVWHIPAVYACGRGLVVDFCVEIESADIQAFLGKWKPLMEEGRQLTPEEEEQQRAENPMTMDYDPRLTVNGRETRRRSGIGSGWLPVSCRPEEEHERPNQHDWESLWLMEHYGLDAQKGWMFFRDSFPWATKTKPVLKSLSLSMEARPVPVPGPRFTVSKAGDTVRFTHPVTGKAHTLHVVEYEAQEMDTSHFPDSGQWEYPTHYTSMTYVVEPELPKGELTARDCGQGDPLRPRQVEPYGPTAAGAASIGIIGGADGPTTIILANGKTGHPHAACSALRFEPPELVQWRMVFFQQTSGDIELELPLPQS